MLIQLLQCHIDSGWPFPAIDTISFVSTINLNMYNKKQVTCFFWLVTGLYEQVGHANW
jgi:hypothetical protein